MIEWHPWSDAIFQKAKAEKKLVLLDLGTGWCHWCHVMDEVTYRDPDVVRLIRDGYYAVRVDADSRPDLANRYEDYGWPATIVFDSAGLELAKRRGYLPPKPMAGMLQAFIEDPTPGPSIEPQGEVTPSAEAALSPEQRKSMRADFLAAYDAERGGWGEVHHYLNWDALEYCLLEGAAGDAKLEAMARQTLTSGLKLIDPVWGGVDQYSTDGDWDHPHFEKIMPFQTENMRVYALASKLWHEPKWLATAEKVRGYLKNFLTSPEGAFYASQDADMVPGEHSGEYFALDDAARRTIGIPRVDMHIYARENGLAIAGLCALYAANGDADVLADARRAVEWVLAHRALEGGGFSHGDADESGPFLGDTLAMGRAFLSLYTVTGERQWLTHAESAAQFIGKKFNSKSGFVTAVAASGEQFAPRPQVDENVMLARFLSLLHAHTDSQISTEMTVRAMRYLAAPSVVKSQGYGTAGLLLADGAMTTEPVHLTVVGAKDSETAKELFATALRGLPMSARIEWLDPKGPPLPRTDVTFPPLTEPAAFLCANGLCSSSIRTVESLANRLAKQRMGLAPAE